MYKLDNNIQWTEELKNAFKHNVTRAKIVYSGNEITYDNGLVNLELEENRYVPNIGFIGQATARKVTLNLLDNEQTTDLENKQFTLYIGADYEGETYYINYGNFIVNAPPENDSTNGNIKVVAYDYMIKFNKFLGNNIIYPCTLKQLLQNICSQAGVELGTEHFANENFIVENNQFENKTLREVLQNIAKCAFSWARIGQDNKLYLDFQVKDEITETLTINEYYKDKYKKANKYYGAVNKVTYGQSDIQGQEESVVDDEDIAQHGVKELVINDNYFAYTNAKRYQLVQQGARLFGLRYMPIQELETIGLIYLDCNDVIEILDEDNNSVITRVFSHTIRYNGATNDSIQTEAKSLNEQTYQNRNSIAAQSSKTEIMVDRANKLITSTVETVEGQNQRISQISQTVDELNSKISDIADVTVSKETMTGSLNFENINASEPIRIEIKATVENISYLYPFDLLHPANDLFIKLRTLRFKNITTNEVFDYELPDDLLYYDSEHYDSFLLDYDGQATEENPKVFVYKKCRYNMTTGEVEPLETSRIDEYEYPTINLTDGNYILEMLKYDNTPYTCYLFARLMIQNIYTTQFATRAELNTEISQTTREINLSVDRKLVATSNDILEQTNSQINMTAESITSTVSQNYTTKTETSTQVNTLSSRIKQTAKDITLTVTNGSVSSGIKISVTKEDGSTEEATGTIEMSGLVKFTDLSRSGSTTINGANITTGIIKSSNYVSGSKGTSINLSNGVIDTKGFKVDQNGNITATSGTIGGFNIDSYRLTSGSGNSYININSNPSTNSAIWIGDEDAGQAPFRVTKAGALKATNANIEGTIKATNGVFENCTIKNSCTVPASTVSGTLATNTIPNISAGKITSGTMSGDRINGGRISTQSITCTDIYAVGSIEVGLGGSFVYDGQEGEDFQLIVNDGEKGWRRLTFKGGILVNVEDRW